MLSEQEYADLVAALVADIKDGNNSASKTEIARRFPQCTVGEFCDAVKAAATKAQCESFRSTMIAVAECMAFDGEPEGTLFGQAIKKWLVEGRIHFPREVQERAINQTVAMLYTDKGERMPPPVAEMIQQWQSQRPN